MFTSRTTGNTYDTTGNAYDTTGTTDGTTGNEYDTTGNEYDATGNTYGTTGNAYGKPGSTLNREESFNSQMTDDEPPLLTSSPVLESYKRQPQTLQVAEFEEETEEEEETDKFLGVYKNLILPPFASISLHSHKSDLPVHIIRILMPPQTHSNNQNPRYTSTDLHKAKFLQISEKLKNFMSTKLTSMDL